MLVSFIAVVLARDVMISGDVMLLPAIPLYSQGKSVLFLYILNLGVILHLDGRLEIPCRYFVTSHTLE